MPDQDLHAIHDLLIDLAKEAGQIITSASPSTGTTTPKANTSDLVTETDHLVECMLASALKAAYPDYYFVGEETHISGCSDLSRHPTFIVDPIDGTLNFVHGFPQTAISLAFVSDLVPLVGVVFNPFTSQLYTAIAGHGSFLHNTSNAIGKENALSSCIPQRLPLRQPAAPLTGLQSALVAVEWGNDRAGPNWAVKSQLFKTLAASKEEGGAMVRGIRSMGSAALNMCAVADGTVDAYWQAGCWIWDVAAGWVIVKEAGGIVVGANPGDWVPKLDGRMYLAIRGAEGGVGQEDVVKEVWGHMSGRVQYTV